MRIVLLGPPGAGKGTQAEFIAKKFNLPHISTGDIFRKNIKDRTSLGLKAKEYIDKGLLVPDEVTVSIVEERLKKNDCKAGFLLDGFPRTVAQADALDSVLKSINCELEYVLNIAVPDKAIIDRITGRRVCPVCGMTYHIDFNPPSTEGKCDKCGEKLIQRPDDSYETIVKRLAVYKSQTEPLIQYYSSKNKLTDVDGEQDIEKVFEDICRILGSDN